MLKKEEYNNTYDLICAYLFYEILFPAVDYSLEERCALAPQPGGVEVWSWQRINTGTTCLVWHFFGVLPGARSLLSGIDYIE